jgi:hypothetical protein
MLAFERCKGRRGAETVADADRRLFEGDKGKSRFPTRASRDWNLNAHVISKMWATDTEATGISS